jgi:hypothetical protein
MSHIRDSGSLLFWNRNDRPAAKAGGGLSGFSDNPFSGMKSEFNLSLDVLFSVGYILYQESDRPVGRIDKIITIIIK